MGNVKTLPKLEEPREENRIRQSPVAASKLLRITTPKRTKRKRVSKKDYTYTDIDGQCELGEALAAGLFFFFRTWQMLAESDVQVFIRSNTMACTDEKQWATGTRILFQFEKALRT